MSSRVIALFDQRDEAMSAQRELLQAGFRPDQLHFVERPQTTATTGEEGWWDRVKSFFTGNERTGEDAIYREAAKSGGILLSADVPDDRVEMAADILEHHHPVDLDRRMNELRGTTTGAGLERGTEERVPIVEEELRVGKRAVTRGGVRIHTQVTEEPVSENVQLREEHVSVERRPVDRPIAEGDRAFQERTIEATETAEEAVVQKEARIVEEVVVRKDVEQRGETVSDTLRRTEVDIERLGEDDLRRDFDTNWASRGYRFEDWRNTYDYGDRLALNEQYRGRDWSMIEGDIRTSYERDYPGRWDRDRDVLRRAFDRRRGMR